MKAYFLDEESALPPRAKAAHNVKVYVARWNSTSQQVSYQDQRIKAIKGDDFPKIHHHFQWGRSNLPRPGKESTQYDEYLPTQWIDFQE